MYISVYIYEYESSLQVWKYLLLTLQMVLPLRTYSKPGFTNMWTELSDVQAGFRKGRRTRDQIANIHWIIEKAREFQKNIDFCFIDYAKAFDCVDHNKLWEILKEMGILDHLTCSWEICMQVRKQQLELDMEQQAGSK